MLLFRDGKGFVFSEWLQHNAVLSIWYYYFFLRGFLKANEKQMPFETSSKLTRLNNYLYNGRISVPWRWKTFGTPQVEDGISFLDWAVFASLVWYWASWVKIHFCIIVCAGWFWWEVSVYRPSLFALINFQHVFKDIWIGSCPVEKPVEKSLDSFTWILKSSRRACFYRKTGDFKVVLQVSVVFQNKHTWLLELFKNYFNSVNYL